LYQLIGVPQTLTPENASISVIIYPMALIALMLLAVLDRAREPLLARDTTGRRWWQR
jgi:hypothetical protein